MTEDFKQAQINMTDAAATILSSKSKTLTCKYKKAGQLKAQRDLSHNQNQEIYNTRRKASGIYDRSWCYGTGW